MIQTAIDSTKFTARTNVLIAIRPGWADQILSGNKKWEYRRVALRFGTAGKLILYASGELHAIIGEATIERIIVEPIEILIAHTVNEVPETAEDLRIAFAGREVGCAIKVRNPVKYNTQITLSEIRKQIPNFMPPQGFYYVTDESPLMRILHSW